MIEYPSVQKTKKVLNDLSNAFLNNPNEIRDCFDNAINEFKKLPNSTHSLISQVVCESIINSYLKDRILFELVSDIKLARDIHWVLLIRKKYSYLQQFKQLAKSKDRTHQLLGIFGMSVFCSRKYMNRGEEHEFHKLIKSIFGEFDETPWTHAVHRFFTFIAFEVLTDNYNMLKSIATSKIIKSACIGDEYLEKLISSYNR